LLFSYQSAGVAASFLRGSGQVVTCYCNDGYIIPLFHKSQTEIVTLMPDLAHLSHLLYQFFQVARAQAFDGRFLRLAVLQRAKFKHSCRDEACFSSYYGRPVSLRPIRISACEPILSFDSNMSAAAD